MHLETLPTTLKEKLDSLKDELAIIDVREQGVFAQGHLLFASNVPLSRFELEFPRLVPCQTTPIVLCDDGNRQSDLALQAKELLCSFGYEFVSILKGGVQGWQNSGYELFSGVNVLSKSFGEYVEEACHTPCIDPAELLDLRTKGTQLIVLDSRPSSEYHRMSIPGAINIPGAELVYRFQEVTPDPDTLIVVNCAGRTRSIIGAQSLINAGAPNRVVALKNGTMGWKLAGLELENRKNRTAPKPDTQNLKWAQNAAQKVATNANVNYIDWDTLDLWQEQSDKQTLYLLDVRTPEEYESGHLPKSRSAPGGQLVQATDTFIGTHGARVVLLDNDGVRARMTASWLNQMGRKNVHVLQHSVLPRSSEKGPETPEYLGFLHSDSDTITPAELFVQSKNHKITWLDLADSRTYRNGHIQGAWFTVRSRISECLEQIPSSNEYVLTSPCGTMAELTRPDVVNHVQASVKTLEGGTNAWVTAGFPLTTGFECMAAQPNDVYWLPYDYDPEEAELRMREYLSWETNLIPQIEKEANAGFSVASPPVAKERL